MDAVATYFDSVADGWDAKSEQCGDKHRAVAFLAGVKQGSRVLDLGCGTGIMTQAYLHLGASEVVGVDVSEKMIQHASRKFAEVPGVRFLAQDAIDLEFVETFDRAIVYNAYPHFKDKAALVESVASYLEPGGRFLVAHGMGKKALDEHHQHVAPEISSALSSASVESEIWSTRFAIDILIDTSYLYAFGGQKR